MDLGAERPGLLHVREMGEYVRNPADFVHLNEEIEVKVLRIDRRKRQIDLTMNLGGGNVDEDEDVEPALSAMEIAFQQAQALSADERRPRGRKGKRQSRRDDMDDIYSRTLRQRD